jgi:Kef-type K+ transport system membrane component KefB
MQVSLILTGVMLAGVCTDAIGIHSVFGAFVYGLVIPTGPLGVVLIEKIEDFVTGLLLPLFFAISGLRTNVRKIGDPVTVGLLVLVFVMASFAKIMGTIIIAALYTMPFREGIALGFLMNTRGLVEMIVLNIGRDKEVQHVTDLHPCIKDERDFILIHTRQTCILCRRCWMTSRLR